MDQQLKEVKEKKEAKIESEMLTLKLVSCAKGGHDFIYGRKANEVKCKRCPVGYILTPGMYMKEGHIYSGDELVV